MREEAAIKLGSSGPVLGSETDGPFDGSGLGRVLAAVADSHLY